MSEITRRELLSKGLGTAAAVGGLTALSALRAAGEEERKPNIIFVFADQLRYTGLGCCGNKQVRTPNLDRFASEGAHFTNAVSGYPVCSPYRAMLITGRYCQNNGMYRNDLYLPQSPDSLANVCKRAGYQTAYIGKWHLDGQRKPWVAPDRRQGFDYWVTENCDHQYVDAHTCYGDSREPRILPGYQPNGQTDLALDYIRGHKDKPFLLCLSWGPPHNPYVVPKPYLQMYDQAKLDLPPGVPEEARHFIAVYYAMTTCLDYNFGRIAKTLEREGLSDNTILVFTSDHGNMLGAQGQPIQMAKQRPWDESVRIPFIIRYPGLIPKGSIRDAPLNTVDVMPTLLGLAGIPIPSRVEGTDLSRIARGEGGPSPESAFLQELIDAGEAKGKVPIWRGVRTRRYTYARTREKPWLLYDNVEDPHQLTNLVDQPGSRKMQAELEDMLQAWLKRTGDDFASAEVWNERIAAGGKS